jgi:hypothetical protein
MFTTLVIHTVCARGTALPARPAQLTMAAPGGGREGGLTPPANAVSANVCGIPEPQPGNGLWSSLGLNG